MFPQIHSFIIMTKDQAPAIPEELYNLTQLAEVTLAAGRLSTTNVSKITDYINSNELREGINDVDKKKLRIDLGNPFLAEFPKIKSSTSSNPPVWLSTSASLSSKTSLTTSPSTETRLLQSNQDMTSLPVPIKFPTAGKVTLIKNKNSSMFFSSSDDDSNYYSHKIFDRKKLRRSTISENSRFDEHSCSSIPSCSGDENYSGLNVQNSKNSSVSPGSLTGYMDDEHICPECGKKYSTSSNLARHRQTHR